MRTVKEIKKKGKNGFIVANLDIIQEGDMTISILPGPVFWKGEDHSLDESSDYVVETDPKKRWIRIDLVKRVSDGKCIVFVDEGYMGEPSYDFRVSETYVHMFYIGELWVDGGAKNLNDATLLIRRWIDRDEIAERKPQPATPTRPSEEEIAVRKAVLDARREARVARRVPYPPDPEGK